MMVSVKLLYWIVCWDDTIRLTLTGIRGKLSGTVITTSIVGLLLRMFYHSVLCVRIPAQSCFSNGSSHAITRLRNVSSWATFTTVLLACSWNPGRGSPISVISPGPTFCWCGWRPSLEAGLRMVNSFHPGGDALNWGSTARTRSDTACPSLYLGEQAGEAS